MKFFEITYRSQMVRRYRKIPELCTWYEPSKIVSCHAGSSREDVLSRIKYPPRPECYRIKILRVKEISWEEYVRERMASWRPMTFKERSRAITNLAISMGILRRRPQSCEECGKIPPIPNRELGERSEIEAHHKDYSKPLLIEWLCRPCHRGLRHSKAIKSV